MLIFCQWQDTHRQASSMGNKCSLNLWFYNIKTNISTTKTARKNPVSRSPINKPTLGLAYHISRHSFNLTVSKKGINVFSFALKTINRFLKSLLYVKIIIILKKSRIEGWEKEEQFQSHRYSH